jgi:hypothetical protein
MQSGTQGRIGQRGLSRALLFLSVATALPAPIAAQGLEGLAGGWTLDRAVSTFGPGDPGAERIDIALSATEVRVTRFFNGVSDPSLWELALDGSAPQPPKRGSALVVDGRLVITHERARETVIHRYLVEGDTLRVERSVRVNSSDKDVMAPSHVMVFRRQTPRARP